MNINILMIIAILAAYIVKGMCGFANTLVFTTILSFKANNVNISPLELLVGYPSNIIIAWKERKSTSPKIYIPLSILVIAGSIPGAIFLKNGDTRIIKMIFGFVVVFIGLEMFFREYQNIKQKSSKIVLGTIGIVSGVLCGLFGVGALLAAYVSRTTDDNSAFKGNLCVVFLVENTFRVILYSLTGIINFTVFKSAIMLIPIMLVGLSTGMLLARLLNEKIVKRIVTIMLILSGISLFIGNISI